MSQNNPYGFSLESTSDTNTNSAYGVPNQNTANTYGDYAAAYETPISETPYGKTVDITKRKKQALTISLGIMSGGLLLSLSAALVEFLVLTMWGNLALPILIGSFVLEFAMVFATQGCIKKEKVGGGIACYVLFAISNGVTFMSIFANYRIDSVLGIFALTTLIFAGTTIVALIIPKDLSGWSLSLIMGLFALLLLSVIYLFVPIPALDFFICIFGVILFIAYTAYDVKKIYALAVEDTSRSIWTVGLFGGMNLYLDFINLLLRILRLFGKRR